MGHQSADLTASPSTATTATPAAIENPVINSPFVEPTRHFPIVDGQVVGRASVRHALSEQLLRLGGHIGYGVLPQFRRRGYATEILRQSLVVARAAGVDRVLVTCDDDNLGSIAVIERCGGRRDPEWPGDEGTRRYWID